MADTYLKDTRPGHFLNHIYKLVRPLRPHLNPPSPTAIIVINMYGILVWREQADLIPATKKEFTTQR